MLALSPSHTAFIAEPRSLSAPSAWPASEGSAVDIASLVKRPGRVIVVAPHPDDEVLGIGGSLAALERCGREVLVVAVTDGDASHPGSSVWSAERLRWARPLESIEALGRLHSSAQLLRLEIEDGRVEQFEPALRRVLASLLEDAAAVFTTWRFDGHADHEACGRAAVEAAQQAGVPCHEYVVWGRVPDHPAADTLQQHAVHRLALGECEWHRKLDAIQVFQSQLHPDPSTGQAAVLSASALASWQQSFEVVIA